jgi:hypothetical protein
MIFFAYQSARAVSESAKSGSDEKSRQIAESPQPKKASPAKKPAPNKKSTPFEKLPAFYKKCEDVLSKYVDKNGDVDYAKLRRKRSDLFDAVRAIQQVETLEYMKWSDNEKTAFWLNAHNIFTLKLIIDNYPIKARWFMINYPANCIMQIARGRDDALYDIIGLEYTIREIEHEMLRDRFADLRTIFTTTYANNSGALLANYAYLPSKLDEQLDEQVHKFLSSDRGLKIDQNENIVHISPIFKWYKKEFIASEYGKIKKFRKHPEHIRSYLNFIFQYAGKENAAYLGSHDFTVEFLPYDWRLNELAAR